MSATTETGATCPRCGDLAPFSALRCACGALLTTRYVRPRPVSRHYPARSCPYCGERTTRRHTCRCCADLPALDPGHPLYRMPA